MQRLSKIVRNSMSPLVVATPEASGAIRITLNRPDKYNALTLEMIHELTKIYNSAPKDSRLLLEGVGKAFCAGGDVKSIVDGFLEKGWEGYPRDFFKNEYVLDQLIASDLHSVCTFWHGVCMGGGIGLGYGAKVRVVTETTMFAMPEAKIGFFPDVGMTRYLTKLNGGIPMGLYIALTGVKLGAKDMLFAGLATDFCPQEEVEAAKKEWLSTGKLSARGSPPEGKAFLHKVFDEITDAFSASSVDEIIAKLKKSGTPWAQETLDTLSELSPISLRVTFRALHRHKDMPLKQVFDEEFFMCRQFLEQADFAEGVTAALVEKRKPKWKRGLSEISETDVEAFFNNDKK